MAELLPPNATRLELALEAVLRTLLVIDVPIDLLWSPETCPEAALPVLAWALSVDEWNPNWSVPRQREVIAASIAVHRHKGTPWAVRRALEILGYGSAELIENYGHKLHDGSLTHDGSVTYSAADHWAEYRVNMARPITVAQADRIRAVLAAVAPARCSLKAIGYDRALNLYNRAVLYDGSYTHGVA